jgi:hypothetical protein
MVGRNDLCLYSSEFINANFYLCGRHFENNMFLSNLRTRLKPNAMPTVSSFHMLAHKSFNCEGIINRYKYVMLQFYCVNKLIICV